MLSSITSYLFGNGTDEESHAACLEHAEQQAAEQGAIESESTSTCKLKTRTTDDEWVLVDKSNVCGRHDKTDQSSTNHTPRTPRKSHSNDSSTHSNDICSNNDQARDQPATQSDCSCGSTTNLVGVVVPVLHGSRLTRSVDKLSDDTDLSGASTPVHVVHPSMEESWLVTPPPCFTAGGNSPQRVERNPMEDLLIEHPSMSVYASRGRPGSTGVESTDEEDEEDSPHPPAAGRPTMALRCQPPRRPRAVAQRAGLIAQVQSTQQMQRAKKHQEKRGLSRSSIDRSNRVNNYQSQCKHQRRKHYMLRPSGRSNNRSNWC